MHLALGSSTGTWNDTWVSALIRIFMMKFGVTSLATKRTWRTPLMTMRKTPRMMTAVTQNYFSDNRKCLPLNLVKDSSAQWKVFARLENPLRDTSPIYSEWDFSLLTSQFSRKSQLIIWACVLIFLYTLPTEAPNWLSFYRPFPRRRAFIYFHPLHSDQSATLYDKRSFKSRTSWDDRFAYQPCVIGSRRSPSCLYNFSKVSRQFLHDHLLHVFYTHSLKLNKLTIAIRHANWTASRQVLRFYNFFVNQSPLVSSLLLLHSPFHLHHKLNE